MSKLYKFRILSEDYTEEEIRATIDDLLKDAPGITISGSSVTIPDLESAFKFRMRAGVIVE